MEIKFQIFERDHLLVQRFSGEFSFEHYMKYTGFSRKNFNLESIRKVVIDFRHIKFDYNLKNFGERMNQIIQTRKNIFENEVKRTDTILIFWVDKPLPTAIANIFKEIFSDLNYNSCSTKNCVLKHLNLTEELFDLENIANNLENTFYE